MTDSDSSDDSGLRRVLSDQGFDSVPSSTDFKMKFSIGSKKVKFIYTLKPNLPLPYPTQLEDFEVIFSRILEPSSHGFSVKLEKGWWIFKETDHMDMNKTMPLDRDGSAGSKTKSVEQIHGGADLTVSNPGCSSMSTYSLAGSCAGSELAVLETDEDRIVVLKNLPEKLNNCNRLYNLISQYGRVSKIFFFKDILEKDLTCKIVMESKTEAQQLVKNLFEKDIFGHKIDADIDTFDDNEDESPVEFEMEDGSRSCKKFRTDDFLFPATVVSPTKVLHISGLIRTISVTEVKQLIAKFSAPVPFKIEVEKNPELGMDIHFGSISESMDALILANNRKTSPGTIQLRFSTAEMNLTLGPTVHTQPDWLQVLKANFSSEIISGCSSRTREAVAKNEDIEDQKLHRNTKNELINSVMNRLKNIFGGAGKPVRRDMREIATQFSYLYPAMFREGTTAKHRIDKVEDLAQKMSDRYRMKMKNEAPKADFTEESELDEPEAKKCCKQKHIYGVIPDKWYKNKKTRPEVSALIAQTAQEQDFAKREDVYNKHREELTMEFRGAKKNIAKVCRGFFLNHRHLASHFTYITSCPPLNENIEQNLRTHLGYLEKYLKEVNQTIEFKKKFQDIELVCNTEFKGSATLKDIHILRVAAETFDKGSSGKFIRLVADADDESDPAADFSSPHIVAELVDNKTFIFELWVEKSMLIGKMDMVTALASFFHLCFCFDLKYPQEGETVADILQRSVAKYGDSSGTRTWKRKDSAEKKMEAYFSKLGRML